MIFCPYRPRVEEVYGKIGEPGHEKVYHQENFPLLGNYSSNYNNRGEQEYHSFAIDGSIEGRSDVSSTHSRLP